MFATGPIGMVSALVQTNPEAMNAELADQDLEAVDELDKELREEGINVRFALTQSVTNHSVFMIVTGSVQSTLGTYVSTSTWIKKGSAAMVAIDRSAGVTPEMN